MSELLCLKLGLEDEEKAEEWVDELIKAHRNGETLRGYKILGVSVEDEFDGLDYAEYVHSFREVPTSMEPLTRPEWRKAGCPEEVDDEDPSTYCGGL